MVNSYSLTSTLDLLNHTLIQHLKQSETALKIYLIHQQLHQ